MSLKGSHGKIRCGLGEVCVGFCLGTGLNKAQSLELTTRYIVRLLTMDLSLVRLLMDPNMQMFEEVWAVNMFSAMHGHAGQKHSPSLS